jgi:predicted metalloprotease with PDZ domain
MLVLLGEAVWRRAGCAICACLSAAAAVHAETLTYVLTPAPQQGHLHVELSWQTAGRTESRLCAVPRCGTVSDVPALFKDLRIDGATSVRRDKACWQIEHRSGAALRCRYTVDPGRRELDWEHTHHPITTKQFFHGLGNAFLVTPVAGGGQPDEYEVLVRWKLPDGWRAVCSWASGPSIGARLKPDDVRQAVYLAGRIVTERTPVAGGGEVTVAMLDEFGFDVAALGQLSAEVIAEQCAFMRETAFPPFVVTAIPVGPAVVGGDLRIAGMGLYQSFALCISPRAELTDGVEHLFAHELFHTWNGRLVQGENPEELVYWFTEGFTDYYALRILFESGRWTAGVYAGWLNRHLREYAANPARNATNEEIQAGYWKQRATVGEVAYQRGLLLGLRWHRLARQKGVTEGIDRLFHALVARARDGQPTISNALLRREGCRVLGDWFGPEFDRYVTRAETIEVPSDALAPELRGRVRTVYEFELGFERERSLRAERVHGLKKDSAAAKAGLREGDDLIGWRIPTDADDQVQLQVKRGDTLKTITYRPRGARRDLLQFAAGGKDD